MIMRFFSEISGLSKIAARFSAVQLPDDTALTKQTLQIGSVRFRSCVSVHFYEKGFFFWVCTVFRKYPKIFIPWNEFKSIQEAKIYGRRAMELSIGTPAIGSIRIPMEIFSNIKTYLNIQVAHS